MKHTLLTALALAAVATTGCGSSGGDDVPAPTVAAEPAAAPAPKLSKPAYIRKADAVCRDMRRISRRLDADYNRAINAGNPGAAAEAIDRYGATYRAWLGEFEALKPPAQDGRLVAVVTEILKAQAATAEPEAVALRTGQAVPLKQIWKARAEARKNTARFGRQYGFKVCGRW